MILVKKNDFEEIWDRIKKNTDIKNLTKLSEVIGITQGGVSRAKKRNNFSAEWAYLLAKRYGLLTEWIMTGEGPRRIEEAQAATEKAEAGFLREMELWAREVSGTGNLDWLENQLESQFPAFKQWREEKNETDFDKMNVKRIKGK